MIDWIGYGWMAGSVSGSGTYFADLTMEVPQGDAVAAAAVTGFSLGLEGGEPGSAAAYVREFGLFEDGTHAVRSLPPPAPPNKATIPKVNKATIPKFRVRDYKIKIRGKDAGMHRVMALARGSVLPERKILARAAAESAAFMGARPRSVATVPARRVASPAISRLVF